MDESTLRAVLQSLPIPTIQFHPVAGSTNDLALHLLEHASPADLTLIAADSQTAGRGRMRRQWVTLPGSALAFSLILRPSPPETAHLGFLAPLAGLAVALALEELGLQPQIKWPNDVLLERKKVCGVLVETVWDGAQPRGTVVGIGVNVAPSSVPPADQVMYPAGCVEAALGQPVAREALLVSILAHFIQHRPSIGTSTFLQAWQQRLAFKGEPVQVQPPGQPAVNGTLQGVNPRGELLILAQSGEMLEISAGDVARLRPLM